MWGPWLFFWPHVQPAAILRFSQPLGVDMTRVFSHLALVHLLLLPIHRLRTPPCSKWELALPSLGSRLDHFSQSAVDWWKEETLSSHPASFPSGLSQNFSCQILGSGSLSQVGGICFSPDPGLHVPSSEAIKSIFLAQHELAILLSVQILLLFLHSCKGISLARPHQDPAEI